MLWLDSTYPPEKEGQPGAARGSCDQSSGVPSEVEAQYGSSYVAPIPRVNKGKQANTDHQQARRLVQRPLRTRWLDRQRLGLIHWLGWLFSFFTRSFTWKAQRGGRRKKVKYFM